MGNSLLVRQTISIFSVDLPHRPSLIKEVFSVRTCYILAVKRSSESVNKLIADEGDAFTVGGPAGDVDGSLSTEELGQCFG